MRTTPEQFQQWLAEPEGARLEFKEAKARYDFDKLLQYCVALANEGGGQIVLGVSDKRPRQVVGTAAFEEPGRTEAGLHQRLLHRIPVEELRLPEGHRVVIVHVPGRLPGTAWQIDGRYLKRAGDELASLSDAELKAIFAEAGPDFSAQVCAGATMADLQPDSIATFRARWAQKSGDARKAEWGDADTLRNAELLVDGGITYAALILFGSPAALGRHLAQDELVFEYRSSEASGPAAERAEYREGFFAWHDDLWGRVNKRNERQSYRDGLFMMDVPTFDEVQVREALLNAVAHRDYRLGSSVFVRQWAQRLEVVSPGGFPPGITTANVLDQQNPRNRRLAEALARCGLIERSGQGMNLMFERAIRQGKALPDFTGTGTHEVRLGLPGLVADPTFVRFMARLGEETLRVFSTHDFLVLDHLHRDLPLNDTLRSRLPRLVEMGAVESTGRGRATRHLLSQRLYGALGAKGVYTRKRGLDRDTNKALLLRHIERNAADGARMAEFKQVLPALGRGKIQTLVQELADEEQVHFVGRTKAARWFPGAAKQAGEAADCLAMAADAAPSNQ
jgi:ATP-dependent DNA helicase RecG